MSFTISKIADYSYLLATLDDRSLEYKALDIKLKKLIMYSNALGYWEQSPTGDCDTDVYYNYITNDEKNAIIEDILTITNAPATLP